MCQDLDKYISATIPIPKRTARFKRFPTPKYLRIKKNVIMKAVIIPLLVLAKIADAVKRIARKKRMKNKSTTPKAAGSAK